MVVKIIKILWHAVQAKHKEHGGAPHMTEIHGRPVIRGDAGNEHLKRIEGIRNSHKGEEQ